MQKKIKNRIIFKYNRGFTLVETLVALSIFAVSITAMIVVVGRGVGATTYSKNKLAASFLSQEGIELVRYIRDTEVLTYPTLEAGWDNFNTLFVDGARYIVDPRITAVGATSFANFITPCSAGMGVRLCDPMFFDPAPSLTGSIYTYDNSSGTLTDSGFARVITVERIQLPYDKTGGYAGNKVTSTVSWVQNGNPFSVSSSEILYDWDLGQ